mmetsp:Transcript_17615/g.38431  ORF Transcript_17615/g.38431 Transcript_17615/m.38431 type:complete len:140 (+) Transcript_17615:2212-2631(+)
MIWLVQQRSVLPWQYRPMGSMLSLVRQRGMMVQIMVEILLLVQFRYLQIFNVILFEMLARQQRSLSNAFVGYSDNPKRQPWVGIHQPIDTNLKSCAKNGNTFLLMMLYPPPHCYDTSSLPSSQRMKNGCHEKNFSAARA